ncbi:uncharacterized protein [Drosophila suzukii]|uniref:Reverse transcriptase n=1 Tax=Drosophila suzukii TaxID=28584 RepID=A0ABM4TRG7_DROSZ
MEDAGGLSSNQYSFRKGISTLDAIERVTNIASKAIAGTRWKGGTKKYCLVVTLGIRNALNSADWGRALKALRSFNIPEYLPNVVHSYLSKRELVLETSVGSRTYEVTAGAPQGFGTRCSEAPTAEQHQYSWLRR